MFLAVVRVPGTAVQRLYVKSLHVGGTRCVPSSTDHMMNRHARIALTVACIRGSIFICFVYVSIQGRVCSRLTLFFDVTYRCGAVAPRFANSVSAPPAAAAVPPRKVNWPVICWPPWNDGACRGTCCFACLRMNWGNWWCGRGSPGYVKSL